MLHSHSLQAMPHPPLHLATRLSPTSWRLELALALLMVPALVWPTTSLAQEAAQVAAAAAEPAGLELSGEWRSWHQALKPNTQGPLAWAHAVQPALVAKPGSTTVSEVELRSRWRFVQGNVLLSAQHAQGDGTEWHARVQELFANAEAGAWQFSLGRKVVGWDVGYGFRPNDVVQQEQRRTLLTVTPQGRPLLQAETFGDDTATSLVWVNPQAHGHALPDTPGDEAALALRWYRHRGARDEHLFARWGQHTQASVGAAVSWVATDELELHASGRWSQRHLGWEQDTTPGPRNPWRLGTQAGGAQWLLGGQWTGEQQQSLMLEWWHDGNAPADATWRQWQARNLALHQAASGSTLPEPWRSAQATQLAGMLAWQTTPLSGSSLRQDNLFARAAWQHDAWQISADLLYMPADHGQIRTASVQWQGNRWRLNLAWRNYGGPVSALARQLPARQTLLLAATFTF
jgi:hypothetical protein